jgi:phosphoserine phosphatase
MTVYNETVGGHEIPLVTDLDGTLIKTDLLVVAVKQLLKKNMLHTVSFFFWLLKGKAHLKHEIFKRVEIDAAALPFNESVKQFLQNEYDAGRKIILATASPETEAKKVAALFPVFSEVYGTANDVNLKGANKRDRLVQEYGEKGFDYIGDADADLVIFEACRFAYLVNPSATLTKKVKGVATVKQTWNT